jgi:hypothetical protein
LDLTFPGGDYEDCYFLYMTPYSLEKFTDVSEECTAAIFNVVEYAMLSAKIKERSASVLLVVQEQLLFVRIFCS